MASTKVISRIIKTSEVGDEAADYRYTLSVSESNRVASYRIPLYSISIDMLTREGKHTSAIARDIFADLGKAIVFYEKIVEARATPLNLHYIIEDEMS
jgi:hypothetical protein